MRDDVIEFEKTHPGADSTEVEKFVVDTAKKLQDKGLLPVIQVAGLLYQAGVANYQASFEGEKKIQDDLMAEERDEGIKFLEKLLLKPASEQLRAQQLETVLQEAKARYLKNQPFSLDEHRQAIEKLPNARGTKISSSNEERSDSRVAPAFNPDQQRQQDSSAPPRFSPEQTKKDNAVGPPAGTDLMLPEQMPSAKHADDRTSKSLYELISQAQGQSNRSQSASLFMQAIRLANDAKDPALQAVSKVEYGLANLNWGFPQEGFRWILEAGSNNRTLYDPQMNQSFLNRLLQAGIPPKVVQMLVTKGKEDPAWYLKDPAATQKLDQAMNG